MMVVLRTTGMMWECIFLKETYKVKKSTLRDLNIWVAEKNTVILLWSQMTLGNSIILQASLYRPLLSGAFAYG